MTDWLFMWIDVYKKQVYPNDLLYFGQQILKESQARKK